MRTLCSLYRSRGGRPDMERVQIMGKNRGSSARHRLADMASGLPSVARQEVPPEECEETSVQLALAPGHEIIGTFVLWRDRYMVEFALVQMVREAGRWMQVARIDTCHDKIHKHQLTRGSRDRRGIVTDIVVIPPNDGWKVVDQGYTEALELMENDWQEHLRRWRSDSQ